jgi:hypothetical protein
MESLIKHGLPAFKSLSEVNTGVRMVQWWVTLPSNNDSLGSLMIK